MRHIFDVYFTRSFLSYLFCFICSYLLFQNMLAYEQEVMSHYTLIFSFLMSIFLFFFSPPLLSYSIPFFISYLPSLIILSFFPCIFQVALHMRANRTFTDRAGVARKNGEEWLIKMEDTEAHIPDVYEEVSVISSNLHQS